jgi:hypothetical protein
MQGFDLQELAVLVDARPGAFFAVKEMQSKGEGCIAGKILRGLSLSDKVKSFQYSGLFGFDYFRPDAFIPAGALLRDHDVVFQVKKAELKTEWNYWHGLIQCAIDEWQHRAKRSSPAAHVCVVADWGRAAGRPLDHGERSFVDTFTQHFDTYMIRSSLVGESFIEHNLKGINNWTTVS